MERKSKFCGKCGTPLGENDKFCSKCGATIQREEVKPESTENKTAALKEAQEIKNVTEQPVKKSSKTGKVIKVIAACLCIVVALLFVCVRFAEDDENDISEALLGRDYMADFIQKNNFTESAPNYFESPDGGTMVKLDEKDIPESAIITGGKMTLYGIKVGETFSLEKVGKKLTSNGYYYRDSGDDFITYVTDLPRGYKEIQIITDNESDQIKTILFSINEGDEEEEAEATEAFDETIIESRSEGEKQSKVNESILKTVFVAPGEKMASWHSERTGYYMIPYTETTGERIILFCYENSSATYAQVYYADITDITPTENDGLRCTGKLHVIAQEGAVTGTIQVVWNSLESLDFPVVSMVDGNQLTDTSVVADDYSYYGLADSDSEYASEPSDYILPDVDKRYYKKEELTSLDKEMLRIARNEVFARHHRKFETQDLKDYFEAKPWYQGYLSMEEFDDSVLNEYEKGNLDLLKEIEGISSGTFEPGWTYGIYECHDGIDAEAEIGWYSDSGEDYISLSGASKDGTGVGEFVGVVVSSKGGHYTAVDEYGGVVDFSYNGIDAIEISTSSNMGGAYFPGFDGVYKKTKDLPHNVS